MFTGGTNVSLFLISRAHTVAIKSPCIKGAGALHHNEVRSCGDWFVPLVVLNVLLPLSSMSEVNAGEVSPTV